MVLHPKSSNLRSPLLCTVHTGFDTRIFAMSPARYDLTKMTLYYFSLYYCFSMMFFCQVSKKLDSQFTYHQFLPINTDLFSPMFSLMFSPMVRTNFTTGLNNKNKNSRMSISQVRHRRQSLVLHFHRLVVSPTSPNIFCRNGKRVPVSF